MLVKDICKTCYNKNRVRPWDEHRKRDKETGKIFVQKDRTWARGRMVCVALLDVGRKLRYIKTDGKPPACCYYLVEQMMTAAQEGDQA